MCLFKYFCSRVCVSFCISARSRGNARSVYAATVCRDRVCQSSCSSRPRSVCVCARVIISIGARARRCCRDGIRISSGTRRGRRQNRFRGQPSSGRDRGPPEEFKKKKIAVFFFYFIIPFFSFRQPRRKLITPRSQRQCHPYPGYCLS